MYDSNLDPFVPEHWAQEGVNILWESMVYGNMVYRGFDKHVASYGDEVNVYAPAKLTAKRKQNDSDSITSESPSASQIKVRLNQRIYVSFILYDAARSFSFMDLVNMYLRGAMEAQASLVDKIVGGQAIQFLDNVAGGLEQLSKTNAYDYLIDLRKVFNDNKVPESMRYLGLCSASEAMFQKNEMFKTAEKIGDQGQALRNAYLGRLGAWDTFLELNTPSTYESTAAAAIGTVDGAHVKGDTTILVDDATGITAGKYIVIAGDWQPLKVLSVATLTVTVHRPLKANVADNAAISIITPGAVNQASPITAGDAYAAVTDGYPAGWNDYIAFDGSGTIGIGSLVSFGTALHEYAVVDKVGSTLLLDRPLEADIADDAVMSIGPNGDYNWGFRQTAVALVSRPLALSSSNVRQAIGMFKDFALRVEISRDSVKEGDRVTISGIYGVKVLDSVQGGVLLG